MCHVRAAAEAAAAACASPHLTCAADRCCMALVHSRIRRVHFVRLNPTRGGLASHVGVHEVPSLNHHFDVFQLRGVLHEVDAILQASEPTPAAGAQ